MTCIKLISINFFSYNLIDFINVLIEFDPNEIIWNFCNRNAVTFSEARWLLHMTRFISFPKATSNLWPFNTLRSRQNGIHFPDDIFKCIFMNNKFCILIPLLMRFAPKGQVINKSALVPVIAWHQPTKNSLITAVIFSEFAHLFLVCIT